MERSLPIDPNLAPRRRGPVRRLLADLVEAVRGSEQDFTTGHIGRAILLLSVPMVLEMVLESVFAVVDIYFVSKLGAEAVATVGITESMLTIVYAVAIGLSMGTTAIVARRIGEKKPAAAAEAAVQAIAVAVATSLPVAALGIFFGPQLLAVMGADAGTVESFSSYTKIMLGGNGAVMLLFVINAIFRGAGDAAIAMRVLWLGNAINIVLDPCLILGLGPFPEMGIAGAAWATVIGRGAGVLLQFWILFRGTERLRIARDQIRVRAAIMARLVRVSIGGIGQFIIATSSWIGLVRIMSTFGSEALAGYTIAIRIMIFTFLPAWGMSNAAATLVGQNLGAGQPERAERSVWLTGLANMCFFVVVAAVYIGFPRELVGIFTREPAVVLAGAECLRYISYGYVFYAWGMVAIQAFNGAGDTTTPTIINFFLFWLLEIPLAYALALRLGLDEYGVYFAVVIAESLLGVVGMLIFRRGRWKTRVI